MIPDIKFGNGRNISDDTSHVRQKVLLYLRKHGKGSTHTAPDISDSLTLECSEVRRALKYFEKQCVVSIEKNSKQTSLQGGRPATVWKIVADLPPCR